MRITITGPASHGGRTETYTIPEYIKSLIYSGWSVSSNADVLGRLIDRLAAKGVLSAEDIMKIADTNAIARIYPES